LVLKPKLQTLRVFLLKPGPGLPRAALRDPNGPKRHGVRPSLPFKGSLWVREVHEADAPWLEFVEAHVLGDVEARIATSGAVLFLEAAGRHFAFVFGHGKGLLEPTAYVRDFGLKVALNAVEPKLLRSVDAKTFESPLTLQTRRQTSRGSSLDAFGLNVSQDLVQAVAGKPREESFAHRILGAEGLAFASAVRFEQLATKCEALLTMYGKDTYKEHFGFIDRLRRVLDPTKESELEQAIEKKLQARDTDRMYLAAPEVEDLEREDWVGYTSAPEKKYAYLDLEDFFSTLPKDKKIALAFLKRARVIVHYSDAGAVEKWSIFSCLTAEINHSGRLYILSGGDWFEADPDYASRIATRVKEIAANPLTLPAAKKKEKEAKFNARIAGQLGHVLLDQKLARCADTVTPIEVCDVFTAKKQLVHVKKETRSSTLSHLFAQGVVSAEALLFDGEFREDARGFIEETHPAMVDLIPVGRPAAQNYEVAYVVITHRLATWPMTLPFFSQVNLTNAARRLEQLGFRVSLTGVSNA
jgi:uncharacterized protein (TIGR04141 family)